MSHYQLLGYLENPSTGIHVRDNLMTTEQITSALNLKSDTSHAHEALYIRLDGSNTPMTGNLDLGDNNVFHAGNIGLGDTSQHYINNSSTAVAISAKEDLHLAINETNVIEIAATEILLKQAMNCSSKKISNIANATDDTDALNRITADVRYCNITEETAMLDLRSGPAEKIRLGYAGSETGLYCPYIGSDDSQSIQLNSHPTSSIDLLCGTSSRFSTQSTENISYVPLNMSSKKITSLADPVSDQDAASKIYVDNLTLNHVDLITDVRGQVIIETGTYDLDDYKTESGMWLFRLNPTTIVNMPAAWGAGWEFGLDVFYYNSTNVHQIIYDSYSNYIYYRRMHTTWGAWSQVCSVDFMVSAINTHSHDGTYLELDGTSTMTGALNFNVPLGDAILDFGASLKFYEVSDKVFDFHFLHSSTAIQFENVSHEVILKIEDSMMTMTKPLSLYNNKITSVGAGTNTSDGVNKGQMDTAVATALPKSGGTMTGDINYNNHSAYYLRSASFYDANAFMSCSTKLAFICGSAMCNMSQLGFDVENHKILHLTTGTSSTDGVNKGQMDSAISTAVSSKYTTGEDFIVTGIDSSHYTSSTTGLHLYNYQSGWPMIHGVVGSGKYGNIRLSNSASSRYAGLYFTESSGKVEIYNSGGTIITCGTTYCYIHKPLYVYGQAITGLGSSSSTSAAMRKDYIDNAISTKFNTSGGTMTGALSMNYNKITYVGNGTSTYDSANFGQLAAKVTKSGDTMTGPLSMSYQRITTMGSGTSYYDACNKGQMDTAVATKANTSHTHNYMPLTSVTGGTNDCNNYRTTGEYSIYTSGAAWSNRPSGASTWWENWLSVKMCGGTTFGVQEWHSPGTRTSYRRYYYATNNWSAWVAI